MGTPNLLGQVSAQLLFFDFVRGFVRILRGNNNGRDKQEHSEVSDALHRQFLHSMLPPLSFSSEHLTIRRCQYRIRCAKQKSRSISPRHLSQIHNRLYVWIIPFSSNSSSLSHRSGIFAEPSRRMSSSAPRTSCSRKSTPIFSSRSISICAPSASMAFGREPL